MVTLASEFPNDNPALHRGVIWVCHEPTGQPEAERAVPGPIVEDDLEALIVIEELEPIEARVEGIDVGEDVIVSEHEPEDDHERVAPRVSEVVLVAAREREEPEQDEPAQIAAIADEELEVAIVAIAETSQASSSTTVLPPPTDDPFATLVTKLVDIAIAANALDIAASLPELLESGCVAGAHAWRDILRGASDDFDACGGATLDEWASDVLARLLGTPAPMLRQELRSRGVAAFGLAA